MFEVVAILIALAAVGGFVFVVRRAGEKSIGDGDKRRLDAGRSFEDDASTDMDTVPFNREEARAASEALDTEDRRDTQDVDRDDVEDADDEAADDAADDEDETAPVEAADAQVEPRDDEDADEDEDADADPDAAEEDEESQAAAYARGLAKTKGGFVSRLSRLFGKKKLDDDLLDELEEVLFTADIGPQTAQKLLDAVKEQLKKSELAESDKVWDALVDQSRSLLQTEDATDFSFEGHKPFVLLMVGVNGVGKTTTIGKITAKLREEGKSVLLAAGDTFRAAAVEQLEIWGDRSAVPVVKGKSNSDPSSVIFDAIQQGIEQNVDVVIADTAGRLQTKVDLMDELKKVHRVCNKALEGAPHETWLVLDSTTGQNAIQQAQIFKDTVNISGIVLTKLDGTAKGGVILGICDQLGVPVRYVGVGEQVQDLRTFDPDLFVSSLFGREESSSAATIT